MQDFEDKEYNIKKKDKGYWELGRLGPDLETEELQAKVRTSAAVATQPHPCGPAVEGLCFRCAGG